MNIEVVTTPNDDLKESGFGSLAACNSVLDAIQSFGYSAILNVCKTRDDLDQIVKRKPTLVVLAVKYIPAGKEGNIWLSEYFAQHGINFTGSPREVLKFDSNKVLAKSQLKNKGIKTADYFMTVPRQYQNERDLPTPFPLFLKPLDAANGNGVDDSSYADNLIDYERKVVSLYKTFKQPTLAEEYLGGREFTVAIIKKMDTSLIVSAIEIVPPISTDGLKILGSQAKKDDSESLLKIEDLQIKSEVTTLAIQAFNGLGVRDFGRIDIKANIDGECFFMEANLVPGMTYGSSYFPMACEIAHGLSYAQVVEHIMSTSLARVSTTLPPNNVEFEI